MAVYAEYLRSFFRLKGIQYEDLIADPKTVYGQYVHKLFLAMLSNRNVSEILLRVKYKSVLPLVSKSILTNLPWKVQRFPLKFHLKVACCTSCTSALVTSIQRLTRILDYQMILYSCF